MENLIFTTKGNLPIEKVKLVHRITEENDDYRIIRVDKYFVEDGEWIGNDLEIQIKRTQIEMGGETGTFN